ncbi:putative mucin TcMUCII [Trypanosoma cruzi]|uniref:Putative mucin TcMUCII n=1 Tax=Trypanosoma cruzi TaxID=5693 RepID=A0A2V2VX50_TRYCR|nr:putative mucin TcMUCII [Trypanosoma cruzi]
MMTCRLLCALLVLVLCCCPSVCVTESEDPTGNSGEQVTDPTKPKSEVANQVTQLPSKTPSPPKTSEVVKLTAEPQGDLNQEQDWKKGKKSTEEETDRDETDKAKDQNQKTNAINTTTTTKTQAPTTTTTTTAPVALSTTTTEAPTTATTRAPSRLREMDGSLSSSAWVCAPLLLAAFALAYTALC